MRGKIKKHFDKIANDYDFYKERQKYYYSNLKELLGSLIPEGRNVFEVGCGTGDLLASLNPKSGYGMDISGEMINLAKSKHKLQNKLKFSTIWPEGKFDYIFMSDVIEHLENSKEIFSKISKLMDKKSRFIITMANPVWEPLLMMAEKLKLKMPEGPHKRIAFDDLRIIIQESGMKIVKHDYKLLVPVKIPVITNFANKYLGKPLRQFAFIEYSVAVIS
ncbi:MAG: class I SAM-dependent methyltransferase [Candidatus Microgenomates bacterium]|jgi:ubiquinone/menaquinone biosynthesis C-methylase UbiE